MRYHSLFAFVLLCFLAISACKDGTDSLKDPVMIVNAIPGTSARAADQITFDVNINATSDLKNFRMVEKYADQPERVLLDSNFAAGRTSLVRNFTYYVPDTASAGQRSVITFTVTDVNNRTATRTQTINITGGRPIITVSPEPTTVTANQQINFNVRMRTTSNTMMRLNVEESVAGSTFRNVYTAPLDSARDTTLTMPYTVGNHASNALIMLNFRVTEADSSRTVKIVRFNMQ